MVKKLFRPSFLLSMRLLSANNLMWWEQVGCERPVSDTTSQQRIDPFSRISRRMLIRYGSAMADMAFSTKWWSVFLMVCINCKDNAADAYPKVFVHLYTSWRKQFIITVRWAHSSLLPGNKPSQPFPLWRSRMKLTWNTINPRLPPFPVAVNSWMIILQAGFFHLIFYLTSPAQIFNIKFGPNFAI